MIDHVSIPVADLARAGAYYDAVLAPLGLGRIVAWEKTIGFGKRYPEFWLNLRPEVKAVANPVCHICLRAPDEAAVRAFHAAGLEHGGADEGAPGPRQAAMTTYIGAFLIDPDGNKIEAVTFPAT